MNPYKLFELCEKLNTELLEAKAEINRLTKIEVAAKAYVSEVDQMPVNMTVAILSEYFIKLKKALAERKP